MHSLVKNVIIINQFVQRKVNIALHRAFIHTNCKSRDIFHYGIIITVRTLDILTYQPAVASFSASVGLWITRNLIVSIL